MLLVPVFSSPRKTGFLAALFWFLENVKLKNSLNFLRTMEDFSLCPSFSNGLIPRCSVFHPISSSALQQLFFLSLQVTLIPTHDSEVMREWYQETHEKQQELNIMVLASSSTVVMQDESFPACKIEL